MKKKIFLLVASVAIGVLSIESCKKTDNATNTTTTASEYIADNNSFKDFMNWTLQSTKHGPDPLLGAMAHANNDSSVTRQVYFKNGQNAVNGKYPTGTIIVKHSSNTAGTVNEFTAMVKRGNNFNPNNNDWEYFMLKPDGTIATDTSGMVMRGANLMSGMCGSCHKSASVDYIFSK
ncbi:MAG: cytochrome P460 family protein [Bacteroidetes bacterium]|nr:cytochrome P460 family protein [Bacteroidota bacterium]